MSQTRPRHLVVILGDQLDPASAALDGFDPARDRLWMAEVAEEATHVWSHKARIALFLAAMRHFAEAMRARGSPLDYLRLGEHPHMSLAEALGHSLAQARPERVVMVRAGDWRVQQAIEAAVRAAGVALEVRPDRHFIAPPGAFAAWARSRRELRLEYWYRELRRQTGLLMVGDQPAGGRWNFDADNRKAFGPTGPGDVPRPRGFPPDAVTAEVLRLVERHFPNHPGRLDRFDWPLTPAQARQALDDFIEHRLPRFGDYQDAMWTGEPWLYHSRQSAALNLKLIDPMTVCRSAEAAWRSGHASLAAVEGFIRQILGWREYVHGLYWLWMPKWLNWNALDAQADLPAFYWSGDTDMACLRAAIGQTLKHGYAHHIQRLMVTGLYALLAGVEPQQVHAWYLAVYVDAVEWVELPNVLGMSQHADGGRIASKPYIASGKYIQRMSNYCATCRYRPERAVGPDACPYTTLYWDFLARHAGRFRWHPRLGQQVRNLERMPEAQRAEIRQRAEAIRAG
ncbi:MAG: cryptochrome/photolyase family protein [Thiobacillaceae bacterium]